MTQTSNYALELLNLNKWFGDNHANKNVDLQVRAASVHGLVGENGAGKSVMMSMVSGFLTPSSGRILIDSKEVSFASPRAAIDAGIGMVYQHFMQIGNMTVLENIVLGAERGMRLAPTLSEARSRLEKLTQEYQLEVNLDDLIEDIPVGIQQRVEILKALFREAKILILDEPTAVLTPKESEQLFTIVRKLSSDDVTVLFITHKLGEIMAITDEVSVMRRGAIVAHRSTANTSARELASLMVGREVLLHVDKPEHPSGDVVLKVESLSYRDACGVKRLDDVSFEIHSQEIVGIAGVSGNGQGELLAILAGMLTPTQGRVVYQHQHFNAAHPLSPKQARALGIAHAPQDRLRDGVVREMNAAENAVLGFTDQPVLHWLKFLSPSLVQKRCDQFLEDFDVRPRKAHLPFAKFSGGNQQKLLMARELFPNPKLMLIGEPTRGVDIGAIEFIYRRIIQQRDAGSAVLLVSADLDEIFTLADRIIVMCAGKITGEVSRAQANREQIGLWMGQDKTQHTAKSETVHISNRATTRSMAS